MTSRTQILAAARALIDREGPQKLTIRRLAGEMGIGPTTLYHYVRDKEDLQLLIVREYIEQMPPLELPDDPRERIVEATAAFHDWLIAWPWTVEFMTTDGFLPGLGPFGLGLVDEALAAAVDCGCTPDQAVYFIRDLWYYTVGEMLVRTNTHRSARPVDDRTRIFDTVDADTAPQLAAIGPRWVSLSAEDTYRRGLRAFVNGLLDDFTG
ncbi:MAG TPA: TetR/AcrR family transcriptional regulator [Candidatus Stackebrandtia excrementipullorum]|nr:TetR/AcrR family transcriptional regulator [Candidatus Stackebrandtia excrementipullorum]